MRYPSIFDDNKQILPYNIWTRKLPKQCLQSVNKFEHAKRFYFTQLSENNKSKKEPIRYLESTAIPSNRVGTFYHATDSTALKVALSKYKLLWDQAPDHVQLLSKNFIAHNIGGDKFLGPEYIAKFLADAPTGEEMLILRYTIEKDVVFWEQQVASHGELTPSLRRNAEKRLKERKLLREAFKKAYLQVTNETFVQLLEMQVHNIRTRVVDGNKKLRFSRHDWQRFTTLMGIDRKKVVKWGPFSIFTEHQIKNHNDITFEQFWDEWFELKKARTVSDQRQEMQRYGTVDALQRVMKEGPYTPFVPKLDRMVVYRKPIGEGAY